MTRLRGTAGALLLWAALPAASLASSPPQPSAEQVHQLVAIGALLCTEAPARDCIDHGWRFADANGDGRLDLAELQAVRGGFLEWSAEIRGEMTGRDRMVLDLARTLAGNVPLGPVFSLYDADGDGRLTREELLADISLDERPLATILMDRQSTDWGSIRARLGRAGALLGLLGVPD